MSENTGDNELDAASIDNNEDMGTVKSKVKEEELADNDIKIAGNEHAYMCGVVEGFYGRPWTAEQRLDLFKRSGISIAGMLIFRGSPRFRVN